MARILVVDDVKFIAAMIATTLEKAGHDVAIATDGVEALRAAREILPDLVLLDLVMPGMNGLEVARRLRADGATQLVPIMMVSAKGDLHTVAEAFAADVNDFLTKPFEVGELLEKVTVLLGDFRMNYAIDDVDHIPTVTVLHDEISVGAIDLLQHALRMAIGGERRPIVLDLSRVRKLQSGVDGALAEFGRRVRELGGDVKVVRPEAGTRASAIFPGIAASLSLHDDRTSALGAARKAARRAGWLTGSDTPAPAAPELPASGPPDAAVRFEMFGALARVPLAGPSLRPDTLDAIRRELPAAASVVLVDLSDIEALAPEDVRAIGRLVDAISLAGRNVKLVNPSPAVAETLRIGGLGSNLFWIKKGPRAVPAPPGGR